MTQQIKILKENKEIYSRICISNDSHHFLLLRRTAGKSFVVERRLRGSSGIIPGVYDLPRTNNNLVGVSRPSPPTRRNLSSLSLDKPYSRRPHCINNEWRQPNFHCYIISYGLHAIGHATAIIISLIFASPCVRVRACACVCVCVRRLSTS